MMFVLYNYFVLLLLSLLLSDPSFENTITGEWELPKHNSTVEIYKSGDKFFGKIVNNDAEDGMAQYDINNPDEDKRDQPIVGLVIIKDMEKDGDRLVNGEIYDPQTGRTYNCRITIENKNEITVRGYVGRPFLGRNQTWVRANNN